MEDTDKAGIVRFILDFKAGVTTIKCSKNVRSITILDSPSKEAESVGALSDAGLFKSLSNSDRQKRNLKDSDFAHFFESPLDKEINAHYEKDKENHPVADDNISLETTSPKMTPKNTKKNVTSDEKSPPATEKHVTPTSTSHAVLDSCEDNTIPLKKDKMRHFLEKPPTKTRIVV